MNSTNDRPRGQTRKAALVVAHSDGFIEVFSDHDVDVHIVDALAVTTGPAAEVMAERAMEKTLPPKYRALFEPGNRRATHMPEKLTPTAVLDRAADRHLFNALETMGDELRGATEWPAETA